MPHWNPRLNPALERAIPADSPGTASHRSVRDPWEFLFGDGTWRSAEVRAWWRDRYGRWVVQAWYHVAGEGTYGEAYLADPERMRACEPPEFSPRSMAASSGLVPLDTLSPGNSRGVSGSKNPGHAWCCKPGSCGPFPVSVLADNITPAALAGP